MEKKRLLMVLGVGCILLVLVMMPFIVACGSAGPAGPAGPAGTAGAPAAASTASLVVSPIPAENGVDATVTILGAGFEPGQEITIILDQKVKPNFDITYYLDPLPVPNENGAFAGTMLIYDDRSNEGFTPGVYTLRVLGAAGEVLASAPMKVIEPPEE